MTFNKRVGIFHSRLDSGISDDSLDQKGNGEVKMFIEN